MDSKKKIAIFASGNGTNAINIFNHFKESKSIEVALLVYNKLKAPVAQKMRNNNVPCLFIHKENFNNPKTLIDLLKEEEIDLIVLAGFLWLLPVQLIQNFEQKIVNIHPSLLPKYGGKGMYGSNVHKAVIENKEAESGITIHFVNEKYDEGKIILQESVKIETNDTPETLAKKIHQLEYKYFPQEIEKLLLTV